MPGKNECSQIPLLIRKKKKLFIHKCYEHFWHLVGKFHDTNVTKKKKN